MPKINVNVPHQLGQAAAKQALEAFIDKMKSQNGESVSQLKDGWVDNVFHFAFSTFGFKIDGKLDVGPTQAVVDASIPLTAIMFKGKIENEIRTELTRLLNNPAG